MANQYALTVPQEQEKLEMVASMCALFGDIRDPVQAALGDRPPRECKQTSLEIIGDVHCHPSPFRAHGGTVHARGSLCWQVREVKHLALPASPLWEHLAR